MTDLRETVAEAIKEYQWGNAATYTYEDAADAAIAAARPIIERELIERIADAAEELAADDDYAWGYIPPWLRSHLPDRPACTDSRAKLEPE